MNDTDKLARQKIIEAATILFAEKGLDGTTTRDISHASGLNLSLISYYFQGKEGLYKEVIHDFALQAEKQLQAVLSQIDTQQMSRESFTDGMWLIVNGMIKMKFANPHISALLQREVLSGLPYAKDIYEGSFVVMCEKVVGILELAQKKGFVRKNLNMYVLFLSMVHATDTYFAVSKCSVSVLKNCYKLPEEVDQYIEQIYTVFIEGILL